MQKKISLIYILIFILVHGPAIGQRPGKAYRTGKSAFENQEFIRAIGWLNLAIDAQKKKYNDAYIYRAKSHLALNQKEKALEDFIIASKLFPDNHLNALHASRLSYQLGKYNQALQFATTTLDRDSTNFSALKIQALALIHTGSAESALIVCERAQELNEDSELLYAKALASDSLGLDDYAIAYYNEAIKKSPGYKPPYHDLGKLLARNDYITKAIEIFSEAAKRFNDIESYRLRAILHNVTGNRHAQITDITKIITLNPARIDLYYRRALLYKRVNLLQNALADISNYIKWDSTSADAWLLQGKILEELYMKPEAIQAFKKVKKYTSDTSLLNSAEKSIYKLKKEQYPPQISITYPTGPDQNTIAIGPNQQLVNIRGLIRDDSPISNLLINGNKVEITDKKFQIKLTLDTSIITISAIDTYGNKSRKEYRVIKTEKTPPKLTLYLPEGIKDSTIYASGTRLSAKGAIEEESTLKHLVIGGKPVNFTKKGSKYIFSDQLDIQNMDTLIIEVVDYFSNKAYHKFPIVVPDSLDTGGSPLGKTWVLLITSDSIKNEKIMPVEKLRKVLVKNYSQYMIDSLIVWRNYTKEKLERKLLFDLPQTTRTNRIEALYIHYIGPGITQGAYTYWVTNSENPEKEFGELNTAIFRTVTEALEHVKHKTIVSESVSFSRNMMQIADSCVCERYNNKQRFPEKSQFFMGIKIENWKTYESIINKNLSDSTASQKRFFLPAIFRKKSSHNITIGSFKNVPDPVFPLILYAK